MLRNKKGFESICKKEKNDQEYINLRAKIIEYLENESYKDICCSRSVEKVKIAFMKKIPNLLNMMKSVEKSEEEIDKYINY